MFNLPYVPTSDNLVDKAFRHGSEKAKKKRSTRKDYRETRLRKSEEERVKAVANIIRSDLKSIVKNFPSYEQLPSFYQRLLDIKVDKDRYKKCLGAVQWCLKRIEGLENKTLADIRITRDTSYAREFLGRSSSLIKQISDELDELIEIKKAFRGFPTIEDRPTLVVAGYPNVGKSTFMRNLTGSEVKIASYPFTTQEILVGYFKRGYTRYQVIDSPGLLDRPMEQRNRIELQAILALSELADRVLFILDPTQEIEPQINLLRDVQKKFTVPLTVVINKRDAVKPIVLEELSARLNVPTALVISAENGEDCRRVSEFIFSDKR
ncbi:MAG: 50S ribosome-binding GTPase [Candidatus Altiarchaeota archaeon]|nr:50S ribosome-binding GTPase [Candidatus Altiarchaeota archaeon]